MDKLKDKLWDELEELDRKEKLSTGDLELAHKLTDTIKNIDKICALEDGGYSQAGNWEATGQINGTYGGHGGNSYANRGKHFVRSHYSNNNNKSNGGSQNNHMNEFREMLEEAADAAPSEQLRTKLERIMRNL